MSTTTDPTTGDVGRAPRRSERVQDLVGLIARLFLGAVLVWAGVAKLGRPLTAERAVQAYEIFPMDVAGWIGLRQWAVAP